eukprot:8559495-Lingulodinium_polyedra.AAC.1
MRARPSSWPTSRVTSATSPWTTVETCVACLDWSGDTAKGRRLRDLLQAFAQARLPGVQLAVS